MGAALQGPLYLEALKSLGYSVDSAAYRSIRNRKAAAKIDHDCAECVAAITMALTIPSLVRAGRFEPAAAASCGWKPWWPGGLSLFRGQPKREGCRFDD